MDSIKTLPELLEQLNVKPFIGSHIDVTKLFAGISDPSLKSELSQDLQYFLTASSKRSRRSSGPSEATWTIVGGAESTVAKYLILFDPASMSWDGKYDLIVGLATLMNTTYKNSIELIHAAGAESIMDGQVISALANDVGAVLVDTNDRKAKKERPVKPEKTEKVDKPPATPAPPEATKESEKKEKPKPRKRKAVPTPHEKKEPTEPTRERSERRAKTTASQQIAHGSAPASLVIQPPKERRPRKTAERRARPKIAPWALHAPLTLPGSARCTACLKTHCSAMPGYCSVMRNSYHPTGTQLLAPLPTFLPNVDPLRSSDDSTKEADDVDNNNLPQPYLVVMPVMPERSDSGLFLDRPANAGDPVADYIGHVVPAPELALALSHTPPADLRERCRHVLYVPEMGLCVDADQCGTEARFLRTSTTPNCEVKAVFIAKRIHFQIHAMVDLTVGAELLISEKNNWVKPEVPAGPTPPNEILKSLKGIPTLPATLGSFIVAFPKAAAAMTGSEMHKALTSRDLPGHVNFIPHVTPDPADIALAELMRVEVDMIAQTESKPKTPGKPAQKSASKRVKLSVLASPAPSPRPIPSPSRTPMGGGRALLADAGSPEALGAWPECGSDPCPATLTAIPEQHERPRPLFNTDGSRIVIGLAPAPLTAAYRKPVVVDTKVLGPLPGVHPMKSGTLPRDAKPAARPALPRPHTLVRPDVLKLEEDGDVDMESADAVAVAPSPPAVQSKATPQSSKPASPKAKKAKAKAASPKAKSKPQSPAVRKSGPTSPEKLAPAEPAPPSAEKPKTKAAPKAPSPVPQPPSPPPPAPAKPASPPASSPRKPVASRKPVAEVEPVPEIPAQPSPACSYDEDVDLGLGPTGVIDTTSPAPVARPVEQAVRIVDERVRIVDCRTQMQYTI
ncbi:hypothetical protein J8273_0760 [Carpediemonas membranifera]|uniref:SET domain-containing protein n=1 Tax=Carpediemonas membranifera TaxID=201153 RepID=A0A8J6EBL3_9EUKA|nr:hypothetical protein J8273_0760 [Carpediemonas membranifera]|eukprot:KAG9397630.1 hypothetical protein J8273_0760 [Carpediemonas membranifera]